LLLVCGLLLLVCGRLMGTGLFVGRSQLGGQDGEFSLEAAAGVGAR
jgi:hypothetical protein